MSAYRKITMPKCPYCGQEVEYKIGTYNTIKIVNLATGGGSSDVVINCDSCNKDFRVTCHIMYYGKRGE